MKVLAFQPWDGGSHRAVRQSIERHGSFQWTWSNLPARGPRWRLRLGAAELIARAGESGVLDGDCDMIFTTSMLDAAQLRAMLPGRLREKPLVLYMHENQFAYPVSNAVTAETRGMDAHLCATNLSSVEAADLVLFNSRYNRDSMLEGIAGFLKGAPEKSSVDWERRIHEKSRIAWPPVEPIPDAVLRNPDIEGYPDGVRVAWPHRLEHDKGPDVLLEHMDRWSEPLDLELVLLGERYEQVPEAIATLRERHGARIHHDGWVEDREAYLAALAGCSWVLSTARHEFFGIAVVEGLLCGCLPWLPERLSYPELLPAEAWGCSPMDPPSDRRAVVESIQRHLAPALAPSAVAHIETCMAELVSPGSTSPT